MGAFDGLVTVAAGPISWDNCKQILPLAVGANQIEQNVTLRGSCPHVWVPLPRLSSVAFRLVYRKE